MMDRLTNIKLVGTNTLETPSGILGKPIRDFNTTYSNQRLVDVNGKFHEVYGVGPDIELQIFNEENIFQSHKIAVLKLTEIITKETDTPFLKK